MAKRRKRRSVGRRRQAEQRPGPRKVVELVAGEYTREVDRVPSAATFFRFGLVNVETRNLLDKVFSMAGPIVRVRDKDRVDEIMRARTAQEVIDLVHLAGGLGEDAWHKRMSEFGSEVLPLIAERLRTARQAHRKRDEIDSVYERLIAELRWRGNAGAEVLMACFDDLNDYGRSLACVVLGLLGARAGADRMWAFYEKVAHTQGSHRIGALWGLIDLKDERVSDALVGRLIKRDVFYETFGFLSLAGNERAVGPLLWAATQVPQKDRSQPLMALVSIAHRIGRDGLVAELEKHLAPDRPQDVDLVANETFCIPASEAEEYFGLFYRGLRPGDLSRMTEGMRRLTGGVRR